MDRKWQYIAARQKFEALSFRYAEIYLPAVLEQARGSLINLPTQLHTIETFEMPTIHYIDACLLFIIVCSMFNLPLLWWFLSFIIYFGFFVCGLALLLYAVHGVCNFLGISIEVPNIDGSVIIRRRTRYDARREANRHWERISATPRERRRMRLHAEVRDSRGDISRNEHLVHRQPSLREGDR